MNLDSNSQAWEFLSSLKDLPGISSPMKNSSFLGEIPPVQFPDEIYERKKKKSTKKNKKKHKSKQKDSGKGNESGEIPEMKMIAGKDNIIVSSPKPILPIDAPQLDVVECEDLHTLDLNRQKSLDRKTRKSSKKESSRHLVRSLISELRASRVPSENIRDLSLTLSRSHLNLSSESIVTPNVSGLVRDVASSQSHFLSEIEKQATMCTAHKRNLTFYCRTCECPVCGLCLSAGMHPLGPLNTNAASPVEEHVVSELSDFECFLRSRLKADVIASQSEQGLAGQVLLAMEACKV